MNLRKKINNVASQIPYIGESLTKEIIKKDLKKYIQAGLTTLLIASAGAGCIRKPLESSFENGKLYFGKNIGAITNQDSRYEGIAKMLGGKGYYTEEIPFFSKEDGTDDNKATIIYKREDCSLITSYSVKNKTNDCRKDLGVRINSNTKIEPNKVYLLKPATLDKKKVTNVRKKAKENIGDLVLIKGDNNFGIAKETETQRNIKEDYQTMPILGDCVIFEYGAKTKMYDKNEDNHLNLVFIPLNGLKRETKIGTGEVLISNRTNGIFGAYNIPIDDIKKKMKKPTIKISTKKNSQIPAVINKVNTKNK